MRVPSNARPANVVVNPSGRRANSATTDAPKVPIHRYPIPQTTPEMYRRLGSSWHSGLAHIAPTIAAGLMPEFPKSASGIDIRPLTPTTDFGEILYPAFLR